MKEAQRNQVRTGGGIDSDNGREQQNRAYTSISPPSDPMYDVYNASFSPAEEYIDPGRDRGDERPLWQFEPSSRAFAEPSARVFGSSAPVMPKTPPKAAQFRNNTLAGYASNVTYKPSTKNTTSSLSDDLPACAALFALGVLSALLTSIFSFILNFCLPSVIGRPVRRYFFNAGCALGSIAQAYVIYKLAQNIAKAVK